MWGSAILLAAFMLALLLIVKLTSRTPDGTPSSASSPAAAKIDFSSSIRAGTDHPDIIPVNDPAYPGWAQVMAISSLESYHSTRYSNRERALAQEAVECLMASATAERRAAMVEEVLAYHHVVYHRRGFHNLSGNVAVTRGVLPVLEGYCAKYRVPGAPVAAIVTWENSGGISRVSSASCMGLGQLSQGAVSRAHQEAARFAVETALPGWLADSGVEGLGFSGIKRKLEYLGTRAEEYDLDRLHERMRREAGVEDERLEPRCNLEDTVLFFHYLLGRYQGQVDLAVAAYHCGPDNLDDIIATWLTRHGEVGFRIGGSRQGMGEAILRHQLGYIDLWKDEFTRDILNGLRTVDGEVTTRKNTADALGDETDIYLWKVIGARGALDASPEDLEALMSRYAFRRDVAEYQGFPFLASREQRLKWMAEGRLVPIDGRLRTKGGRPILINNPEAELALPEIAGLVAMVHETAARRSGRPNSHLAIDISLPETPSGLPALAAIDLEHRVTHLKAAGVDFNLSQCGNPELIGKILQELYLRDRIYLHGCRERPGTMHACVNPRYAREFVNAYNRQVRRRLAAAWQWNARHNRSAAIAPDVRERLRVQLAGELSAQVTALAGSDVEIRAGEGRGWDIEGGNPDSTGELLQVDLEARPASGRDALCRVLEHYQNAGRLLVWPGGTEGPVRVTINPAVGSVHSQGGHMSTGRADRTSD